jgi:hypothetical protein
VETKFVDKKPEGEGEDFANNLRNSVEKAP